MQGRKLVGGGSSGRRPCAGGRSPRPEVSAACCGRGYSLPELPCVCFFAYHPATLLLLRAGLYLAGGDQLQAALLRSDCGCRRRGFASPQSSPREE